MNFKYEEILKSFFLKMNSVQLFIVGLAIALMVFIYFSTEKLSKAFKEYNDCVKTTEQYELSINELEKMAENEVKLQLKIDSLLRIRREEMSMTRTRNKREISREMDRVKYNLNSVSNITYYKVDYSKAISEGEHPIFQVFFSTDSYIETNYSQQEHIFGGLEMLSKSIAENGIKYYPDLKTEQDIYYNNTKGFFVSTNTKAIIGVLIKKMGSEDHLLTISFEVQDPRDVNEDLFFTIRNLKAFIKKRI